MFLNYLFRRHVFLHILRAARAWGKDVIVQMMW